LSSYCAIVQKNFLLLSNLVPIDQIDKDFKVTILNTFKELKNTTVKEVKVIIMPISDQLKNINKGIKLFFKNPNKWKLSNNNYLGTVAHDCNQLLGR
jgi:hypothetical protein